MRPSVQLFEATIAVHGDRILFDALSMHVGPERVAIVGRNGVGKSTLLDVLAGLSDVQSGRVKTTGKVVHVAQQPTSPATTSAGERRRCALESARTSGADVLLLDEPTEDLDDAAVAWLRAWLRTWSGCLVVVSHDRRLLADFPQYFVVTESGCRCFEGSLDALEADLEREHREGDQRYVRNLRRLVAEEEHTQHVARRRQRKKRYGRCSELDRNTPRITLNKKRSEAEGYHGRGAQLREARIDALREWTLATRRALAPRLDSELPVPELDAAVPRRRIAVVGPNGSGKTTLLETMLLETMLGRHRPSMRLTTYDLGTAGVIAQGAADWMLEDSLAALLGAHGASFDEVARLLVVHRFPVALAERPLRSLSPGERSRAALIALFRRTPPAETLVLDEPTYALDLVGKAALTRALRAWRGGLVVASHDRDFLATIGVDEWIEIPSDNFTRIR